MFTSPRPQKAPAGAGGKPAGDGGAAGASGSARPDGEGGIGHRRQPSRTSEGSSLASDVEPVASIPAMNAARASVGSLPELAHSLGAESEESDDDGDAGEEIASLLHQGEQSEQMRLFDLAVRMSGERELPSIQVGGFVMDELRKLDHVGYVRFASVYRSFQDVADFREELDRLEREQPAEAQLPLLAGDVVAFDKGGKGKGRKR